MCGINEYYTFNQRKVDGMLTKMRDSLAHRGPDDQDYTLTKTLALDMGTLLY
jgi:asparagine synthetase B (glutamine-hydrolysing)